MTKSFLKSLVFGLVLTSGELVVAQEGEIYFNIPSMPLSEAIIELSERLNIIVLAPNVTFDENTRVKPVVGDFTPEQALRRMFEGHDLSFEFSGNQTVIIRSNQDTAVNEYQNISFPTSEDYQENLGVYVEDERDVRDQVSKADEIVVTADARDFDKTKISRGTEILLKSAGSLNDPIWAILSMPSVSIGEGEFDRPVIRGSGPANNLFLIDDMEVGYLYHGLGDSVVSKNVVHNFDLQAAAFGAEYGNATGGVVSVGLRNPRKDGFHASLDVSMLKTGGIIETSLGENSGFYVDFRYNTAHLFLTRFEDNEDTTITRLPESLDYTGRYRYEKDGFAITLTALGAYDLENEDQNSNLITSVPLDEKTKSFYHTQGVKLEKSWDNGHYFQSTLSHTRFEKMFEFGSNRFEKSVRDGYYARNKYSIDMGAHFLTVGANFSHISGAFDYNSRRFYCDDFNQFCAVSPFNIRTRTDDFDELEVYIKDEYDITNDVRVEVGGQFSRDFFLDENFFLPRVGLYYYANDNSTFYARAGRYNQRPELDRLLTLFVTQKLQKNETSNHFVIGNRWDFDEDWYVKTEGYYKSIYTVNFPTDPWETQIEGDAYGAELLLAKTIQEEGLYGWLSLSYSKSKRFDKLSGRRTDYKYSRPLSITAAINYNFRSGWNIGTKYSLQSGALYTPVNNVTLHPDGYFLFDFGALNSVRTSTYQRVDLRLEKEASYSFANVTYYLDVLNLFGTKNLGAVDYPPELVSSNGNGGFIANPDDPSGVPFFVGVGVNLTF